MLRGDGLFDPRQQLGEARGAASSARSASGSGVAVVRQQMSISATLQLLGVGVAEFDAGEFLQVVVQQARDG